MPNRLGAESSPYLLQHANNPVDWYPWSDEALRRARGEDKPIFLSIGYAACHWCHVMEHESFENDEIAAFLNQHFVSIKVDREERPDLDHLYMHAVMTLRGGGGGWPLSAFLTPNQEVFFGGTYWPPTARQGLPGFKQVLQSVFDAYRDRRGDVLAHAQALTEHLTKAMSSGGPSRTPEDGLLIGAARLLERHFDFHNGGFGSAPKFPHALDLSLLIRLYSRWPAVDAVSAERLRQIVELSLERMGHGGIFDHLGGGFARYSVDERWLVPHFEKMLYDNAMLASTYLDAYRTWGNEFHALIARKTLEYMQRDLSDEAGGFHSSEDADSEGEEGKFYVWSHVEIVDLLGEHGPLFCRLYDVSPSGNFEGHNILNLPHPMEEFARREGLDSKHVREVARACRQKLLAARQQRVRPGKDDKVLVNWNGLAIDAFAQAAIAFDSAEYLARANECAEFIWRHMRDRDGRLLHAYRLGVAKQPAFLDDYAALAHGLITLYQASWDGRWLSRCAALVERIIEDFGAGQDAGYFFTSTQNPSLIARWKDQYDSSTPSGNALAAMALLRLGLICQNESWLEAGRQIIEWSTPAVQQSPASSGQMLMAIDALLDQRLLVVLVASENDGKAESLARKFQRRHSEHLEFVVHCEGRPLDPALQRTLEQKPSRDGQLTAYLCEAFACRAPIVGVEAIESTLEEHLAHRKVLRIDQN